MGNPNYADYHRWIVDAARCEGFRRQRRRRLQVAGCTGAALVTGFLLGKLS